MVFLNGRSLLVVLTALSASCQVSHAQPTQYVASLDGLGNTVYLLDNRRPALYTGNFGDCLGNSSVNVTRFHAAYYKDNMTILFHLAGHTALTNESMMMFVGVYAYGENRFDLTFNPCNANIKSLCPLNASVPIEASGLIPVSQSDVSSIPSIAFKIPDFEGEAILRIFQNSTQSEIGCYSAVVTNGNSFSQPAFVGTTLGIFTIVAMICSFATAIYGNDVCVIRKHYAHSLSVLVVFAVHQHIFFTGAMSLRWPSVLVAWWSNFAWAGGMIYSKSMQTSVDRLVGSRSGNTSQVRTAISQPNGQDLAGVYNLTNIYSQPILEGSLLRRGHSYSSWESGLFKRALTDDFEGYKWYGSPISHNLPLPGDYSGFAGTLAQESIPVSNAFTTGFIWLFILAVTIVALLMLFKWTLEVFARLKFIRQDRLIYFRANWLRCIVQAVLRTTFIAFFMIMVLTLFEFSYGGSDGILALSVLVFLLFFICMLSVAMYACYDRLRHSGVTLVPCRLHYEPRKVLNILPWAEFYCLDSQRSGHPASAGSIPLWKLSYASSNQQRRMPEDEEYLKKFGWLAARFRASRWWFFSLWLCYQFLEACLYGGGSANPLAQVFSLLILQVFAFITTLVLKPFEGRRLNALVVYFLGLSKVMTAALCVAFDVRFNLTRTTTAMVGIVIIILQGTLVSCLIIAIIVGAMSSYWSLTRNYDVETFRPRYWTSCRERYFKHLDYTAGDRRHTPSPPTGTKSEDRTKSCFSVNNVRRVAKIEDEDPDNILNSSAFSLNVKTPDDDQFASSLVDIADPDSITSLSPKTPSSAYSQRLSNRTYSGSNGSVSRTMSYTSLPRAARVHRVGWSSREFSENESASQIAHSQTLSHPFPGYSYSGFHVRGPDLPYPETSRSNAACSETSKVDHEKQRISTDYRLMAPCGGELTFITRNSKRASNLSNPSPPATLTGSIEDNKDEEKSGGVDNTKAKNSDFASMDFSKQHLGSHKVSHDDGNEDTINGTTLFEEPGMARPLRKKSPDMDDEVRPEDSLSTRASPTAPIPTPTTAQDYEASARPAPRARMKEHEHEDEFRHATGAEGRGQDPDGEAAPHQLHGRLSLGDSFAFDLFLPTGLPLRRDEGGEENAQRTRRYSAPSHETCFQ